MLLPFAYTIPMGSLYSLNLLTVQRLASIIRHRWEARTISAISAGGTGNWQTKTGSYQVSLSDNGVTASVDTIPENISTTATLVASGTVNSTIDQNDLSGDPVDDDYYKVTLTGGHSYTFSANANVNTSDTLDQVFIRLRDASGNPLTPDVCSEGATPSFTYAVPGSGNYTYCLAISAGGTGYADKTGAYSISLADNGVISTAADAVPGDITTTSVLPVGTIYGTISQTDVTGSTPDDDYYKVTLNGGEKYTFMASAGVSTSDTLDSVLIRLRDADGNIISTGDVSASGPNPSFDFSTPGSGPQTYYLAISGSANGSTDGVPAASMTGQYSITFKDDGPVAEATNTPTFNELTPEAPTPGVDGLSLNKLTPTQIRDLGYKFVIRYIGGPDPTQAKYFNSKESAAVITTLVSQ